ncbi:uncharacterized protein LOC129595892 [Paramacrobiotus metropolitanus]|uniref:uncharacterized protein LOC129595892 n=1 Tax=Paramacrobiotus metropolitanus TaxID=2943436 RepID=UPI0024465A00|nr:uncharacterized protein LOC129595892 [Paramacrobiotus metropolitanus]
MAMLVLSFSMIVLFGIIDDSLGLSCMQCKNFDTFLISPQLNLQDCTNASNSLQVDCGDGQFCVKLSGAIYGSTTAFPQPNTLDGIQRGCANEQMIKYLKPDGAAYGAGGSCQTGDRYIPTPYQSLFQSNLRPTYKFSGTFCFCRTANCNSAGLSTGSFLTLFGSLLLSIVVVLLQ